MQFQNTFYDKLKLSAQHEYLKDLRVYGANLTRDELAKKIKISAHSIRRYESPAGKVPPAWYEILLRFVAGDLLDKLQNSSA